MHGQKAASRGWTEAGLAALGVLLLLCLYLAWDRIIQVDEAQNVTMARIIGTHRTGEFMSGAPLMLLGPLAWIARAAHSAEDLFHAVRVVFAALMWVNLVLLTKGCGVRLRTREGLVVLLLAATLAPVWDYGFEIRHDNLLLTGVLGLWLVLRPRERPLPFGFLAAGFLAGLMQFAAFKGFLYSVPILAYFLLFLPAPVPVAGRGKALLQVLGGLLLAVVLGWSIYRLTGTWSLFMGNTATGVRFSMDGVERFAPWPTLQRLASQTPLLVGGALAVLAAPFIQNRNSLVAGMQALLRGPAGPGWALAVICLAAFLANPTPFPYNLVLLVPALFIAVLQHREPVRTAIHQAGIGWLVWPLLASAHFLPWMTSTWRHLGMSNERQLQLATLAEELTDPGRHRVFDGSGLVPTRDPLGFHWLIHTFTIRPLSDGTWPSVGSELAAHEVPVILPSYRTSWLPEADQRFIAAHYIGLAQDFLLLGARLEGEDTRWTALATGNYFIQPNGKGDFALEVDGHPARPGPLHLDRGPHRFRCPPGQVFVLIWTGPKGGLPPRIEDSNRPLFLNWY